MSDTDRSVWLQDLTWRDVESYLETETDPTAIVPIGSTEQHGPHLPLGVDGYQALDVAEGIAERAGVLTTPPLWFGDAGHHMAFPGTISLSPRTVIAMLEDVYESLLFHGFENVLTVNGHRLANLPAIDLASKTVRESYPDAVLASFDLVRANVRIHNELREGGDEDGMHGGEFETSFMLYKHPDLVKEGEFTPEVHAGSWTRFSSNDYVAIDDAVPTASSRHDWGEDALGHHGDPTKASAEKGEALYEAFVENGVEFIDDVRALREAERSDGDVEQGLTY